MMIFGRVEVAVLRGDRWSGLDSTAVRPARRMRSFMADEGRLWFKIFEMR
jgi:hypothetical protein